MSNNNSKSKKRSEMSEDVRRREHFPKLLPRTKRIKEVDTASNATIEEVDNYYKSFLKLYNVRGSEQRMAALLYSKPGFLLKNNSGLSGDILRMILTDKGIIFEQEFDNLADNAKHELKSLRYPYYHSDTHPYPELSPLKYAERKFREGNPNIAPALRRNFDQYVENARTKKYTYDQIRESIIPTNGLTKDEAEWLKKEIYTNFLKNFKYRQDLQEGKKGYCRNIGIRHRLALDCIYAQEQEFDRLHKKTDEWWDQKALNAREMRNIKEHSNLQAFVENMQKELDIRLSCEAEKIAEDILKQDRIDAYVIYQKISKHLRMLSSREKMRSEVLLAEKVYQFCAAADPEYSQVSALQNIWKEWIQKKAFLLKGMWDNLWEVDTKERKDIETAFPPIRFGLYIRELLYASLPNSTEYLAYGPWVLKDIDRIKLYKEKYCDEYKKIVEHESRAKRLEEYEKIWFKPEYTRFERSEFLRNRLRYVNIEIPDDNGLKLTQQQEENKVIPYRDDDLRCLIFENALQDCILEKARIRLWNMATMIYLFNQKE